MSLLLFIRLLRLRRRVCVPLRRLSTAIWGQSSVVVWTPILTLATNPPERSRRILTVGCDMSRFGPGALEFSPADENGCDGIQLVRCWWHRWSPWRRWRVWCFGRVNPPIRCRRGLGGFHLKILVPIPKTGFSLTGEKKRFLKVL